MNTKTRIGKIARLPHSIREQLNLKLHDGVPAKSILPWLNSLPEAKAILADFDNCPISKQNLSEWKQGGHRDWLLQFNAAHFLQFIDPPSSSSSSSSSSSLPDELTPHASRITDTEHASRVTDDPTRPASRLTSKLLLWTQLQYTAMARHIDSESDPDRKWSALRQFATDISRLRRSSLADDYLQVQRDWLALSQSNTADKKEKDFWKWTQRPDIEKKLFPDRRPGLTPEQIYDFEKAACLLEGPGPEIAELMAEVRIAKKLLEIRKAREAEAKAKAAPDYDPNRPLPDTKVRLGGMPFEELFPTIPEKPLTETHPELNDDRAIDDSNGDSKDGTASSPSSQGSAGRTAPNPADLPSDPSYESDQSDSSSSALRTASGEEESDSVKPGQTQSNQIQPGSPLDSPPNSNNDNPNLDH